MGTLALHHILMESRYQGMELHLISILANNADDYAYEGKIPLSILSEATRLQYEEIRVILTHLQDKDGTFDLLDFDTEEIGTHEDTPFIHYRLNIISRHEWEIATLKTNIKELSQEYQELIPKGYVYLLQCGPYFKIGRTTNPPRRMTQLSIQLPHKPRVIHTIATNAPELLEDYFHKSHHQKRLNGEWFDLSIEDIHHFGKFSRIDLNPNHRPLAEVKTALELPEHTS